MKTLGGLDELPSADPVLARTWLLAHLIAAVLTDDLANEIVGFSPLGVMTPECHRNRSGGPGRRRGTSC